jgi:Spy/CpxP family protein refolding chaperone
MKRRIVIIACMIGLMTAIGARAADDSTNAPSAPNSPSGDHHPPRPMFRNLLRESVLNQLALTPEQKAKYDPLNASFKSDLAKWRADNAGADTDAPSGGGRQAMQQLHKNYIEKLRAFLTPEQNATLDKAMQHGPGPGGHGGPNSGSNTPPPQPPPPGNN